MATHAGPAGSAVLQWATDAMSAVSVCPDADSELGWAVGLSLCGNGWCSQLPVLQQGSRRKKKLLLYLRAQEALWILPRLLGSAAPQSDPATAGSPANMGNSVRTVPACTNLDISRALACPNPPAAYIRPNSGQFQDRAHARQQAEIRTIPGLGQCAGGIRPESPGGPTIAGQISSGVFAPNRNTMGSPGLRSAGAETRQEVPCRYLDPPARTRDGGLPHDPARADPDPPMLRRSGGQEEA
eukprot:gene12147-biopygen13996